MDSKINTALKEMTNEELFTIEGGCECCEELELPDRFISIRDVILKIPGDQMIIGVYSVRPKLEIK